MTKRKTTSTPAEELDILETHLAGTLKPVAPPMDIVQRLRERLPQAAGDFNVGYGQTECGGLCSMATAEMLLAHPDTAGRTIPGNEVAIFDDEGQRLGENEEGNICVRGPNVMLGYWRNPKATADAFFPGGWLRTGDIGRLRDGLLFLASRKRDLIIRGGENIYPLEIENRIDDHPDVEEVAVVGVDHRELGQEVKAIVVLKKGKALAPKQIQEWVAAALAYYKVPTYVEIRTEPLPRNATGKVLKQVLKLVRKLGERSSGCCQKGYRSRGVGPVVRTSA